jgi:hypothetical protein
MGNAMNSVSESESSQEIIPFIEARFYYEPSSPQQQVIYDKVLAMIEGKRFKYKKKYDDALTLWIQIMSEKKQLCDKYLNTQYDKLYSFQNEMWMSCSNNESTETNYPIDNTIQISLTQQLISSTYPVLLCLLSDKMEHVIQPVSSYVLPIRHVPFSTNTTTTTNSMNITPVLLVGPYMFYVNEYGLCIPQIHATGLFRYDIMKKYGIPISDMDSSDISKIAKIAVQFNVNEPYHPNMTLNIEFLKRCIQKISPGFIESNKLVSELLNHLRSNNDSLKLICTNNTTLSKANNNNNEVVFHRHEELDLFMNRVLQIDKRVSTNLPILWSMFLCFDNVFHVQLQITRNAQKYAPTTTAVENCPFHEYHQSGNNNQRFLDNMLIGNKKIQISSHQAFRVDGV